MKKIKVLALTAFMLAMLYGCGESDHYYDVAGTFEVSLPQAAVPVNEKFRSDSYYDRNILVDAGIYDNSTQNTGRIDTASVSRTMLKFQCSLNSGGTIDYVLRINDVPSYVKDYDIERAMRAAMGQYIKEYYFDNRGNATLQPQSAKAIVIKIGYDN